MVFALVTAATAIANIVKSSLGPVGLDKMLVDDVGVSFLHHIISFFPLCVVRFFLADCFNVPRNGISLSKCFFAKITCMHDSVKIIL